MKRNFTRKLFRPLAAWVATFELFKASILRVQTEFSPDKIKHLLDETLSFESSVHPELTLHLPATVSFTLTSLPLKSRGAIGVLKGWPSVGSIECSGNIVLRHPYFNFFIKKNMTIKIRNKLY